MRKIWCTAVMAALLCRCTSPTVDSVKYDPAKMDAGYFYEYHGSVHPRQFVESDLKIYFYIISGTRVESLYAWADAFVSGVLRETAVTIDTDRCLKQAISERAYLAAQYKISPFIKFDYKRAVDYDFSAQTVTKDEYWVDSNKPETILHPIHDKGVRSFQAGKLPVFEFFGGMPVDIFIAGRFLAEDAVSRLRVNDKGYITDAFFIPHKTEAFSYNGSGYSCKRFKIKNKGIMAQFFGKETYFLRESDSGVNYPVCFKGGDAEYRLARRTAMKIEEWEAFKQTVKDEFSPEGYIDITYEE